MLLVPWGTDSYRPRQATGRTGLGCALRHGNSSRRGRVQVDAGPTLICPKPMVMAAAEVKPLMTGQEIKSSRNPVAKRERGLDI